jgi:hypothetical protein
MASALVASGVTPHGETSSVQLPLKDNGIIRVSVTATPSEDTEEDLLVVSPYTERPHLLDLSTVDIDSQLLAKALVSMKNLKDDYATADYKESFNWSEVVDSLRQLAAASNTKWKEVAFYIVVFRSQIPPTTAYADLGVLDQPAHAEAMKSGGFLKCVIPIDDVGIQLMENYRYWFGTPDQNGRNLATCVW